MNVRLLMMSGCLLAGLAMSGCAFEPFAKIPFTVVLSEPENLPTEDKPSDLISGDFNGDGHLDLVSLHFAEKRLKYFAGDGAGGFDPLPAFKLQPHPVALRVADANGDQLPDIWVLQDEVKEIALFLGDAQEGLIRGETLVLQHEDLEPEGSVETPEAPPANLGGTGIEHGGLGLEDLLVTFEMGDFNGDGDLDLVLGYDDGEIEFFTGDGAGHFDIVKAYRTNNHRPRLATFDAQGDGFDDLLVFGNRPSIGFDNEDIFEGSALSILSGNEDGFSEPQVLLRASSGLVNLLTVTDFDSNGLPDPVVGYAGNGMLTIVPNLGNGEFDRIKSYLVRDASGVAFADLDLNGSMDVITSLNRGEFNLGNVEVFLNAGDYRLRSPEAFKVRLGPRALVSEDFDENGLPDIAVINSFSGEISLLFNLTPPSDLP